MIARIQPALRVYSTAPTAGEAKVEMGKDYPGRNPEEIFSRIDTNMRQIAKDNGLDYTSDPVKKTGTASAYGASASFAVRGTRVDVVLNFPWYVPKSKKDEIIALVQQGLDQLFDGAERSIRCADAFA